MSVEPVGPSTQSSPRPPLPPRFAQRHLARDSLRVVEHPAQRVDERQAVVHHRRAGEDMHHAPAAVDNLHGARLRLDAQRSERRDDGRALLDVFFGRGQRAATLHATRLHLQLVCI